MHGLLLAALPQVLLSFVVDGEGPVRFGFPLPANVLANGLRVEGHAGARLQWRPLHAEPDPQTGRLWVELAIAPARGALRIHAGGAGPGGDAVVKRTEVREAAVTEDRVERTWSWVTGDADVALRATLRQGAELDAETWHSGESRRELSPAADERWLRVRIPPAAFRAAGVLPRDEGVGAALRDELCATARSLVELPGARGAGDFGRSGATVTNLEFDTVLAFARLGLASGDRALLARALRSARHLIDHDLDPTSGLPCRHGPDHRAVPPEPGHVWLQGLLLVGCLAADDELLAAARGIAHALASHPARPPAHPRAEHARDLAWPLLELERFLRFAADPGCARAADGLAVRLLARFDPALGVLRFGEGECRGGVYEERLWLTGGVVLPALRAHSARTRAPKIRELETALERTLTNRILAGGQGLPLRCWLADAGLVGEYRAAARPEGFLLLEGLSPPALRRSLARAGVRQSLGAPPADDPDLATSFSMAARCEWILR